MGSILPPIPEDLFLECILEVIVEGTFDEVIAHSSKLHFVNIDWSRVIRNHLKWLAQFQAMWTNHHYATYATIFSLQVLGESLELNPNHDQEMQDLEYYTNSTAIRGESVGDVFVWIFVKVVAQIFLHGWSLGFWNSRG